MHIPGAAYVESWCRRNDRIVIKISPVAYEKMNVFQAKKSDKNFYCRFVGKTGNLLKCMLYGLEAVIHYSCG